MSSAKSDTTIVYQNVDNHLLRLLKENYSRRNKRYYAIQLPYCKPDHIPEEARLFKKFRLPEDLTRLVKTIHGISCLRFLATSDTELLESIRCASMKIFENEASSTAKNTDETGKSRSIIDFVIVIVFAIVSLLFAYIFLIFMSRYIAKKFVLYFFYLLHSIKSPS